MGFCHAARVLTVVVVDDDEAIREAMADLLALDGFDVLVARDGAEALEVLRRAPRPCVAVIDLVMPRVDGWALMRRLATEPEGQGVRIVCCTAGRAEAPEGCTVILRKPFDGDVLLAAVQRAFAS